jgi:hypothetical protein
VGRFWLAILSLLLFAQTAASQPMTDTEMRAAYCLPIIRSMISQSQAFLSNAQAALGPLEAAEKSRILSQTEQTELAVVRLTLKETPRVMQAQQQIQTRLLTYLEARGFLPGSRDFFPVLAIGKQAQADQAACAAEPLDSAKVAIIDRCTRKCSQEGADCIRACLRPNSTSTCRKVYDCANADFLPF